METIKIGNEQEPYKNTIEHLAYALNENKSELFKKCIVELADRFGTSTTTKFLRGLMANGLEHKNQRIRSLLTRNGYTIKQSTRPHKQLRVTKRSFKKETEDGLIVVEVIGDIYQAHTNERINRVIPISEAITIKERLIAFENDIKLQEQKRLFEESNNITERQIKAISKMDLHKNGTYKVNCQKCKRLVEMPITESDFVFGLYSIKLKAVSEGSEFCWKCELEAQQEAQRE